MPNCKVLCVCLLSLVLAGVSAVSAQTFESVGVRAQGLGGAFVAVADDATASWWNPAGLATGRYLSAVVERGQITEPVDPVAGAPAARTTFNDFAVAFPALGISYYRLRVSAVTGTGSTGADGAVRQDQRVTGGSVRSVAVSQFGSTVGQSLGDHLVVGSTLKLLRAGAASTGALGEAPLDTGDDLSVSRRTRADLDIGAMANFSRVRVGLAVKNLTTPTLDGEDADGLSLPRQARIGLAVLSAPHSLRRGLTFAADADLTTMSTVFGDVRHLSAGLEGWLANGRLGLRGGGSVSTAGERRPTGSAGISVALTRALHISASRTLGRDESVTGWSGGVDVAF
jgi:hypothetical protein